MGGLPSGSDPGRFSPRPERKCRSQANRVPRAGAARSRPLLPVRYALRGPSLAPRGIKWRSLPGLDGRCVARCWYPQLPNRCRTGWSRKASYLLARDQPVTPPTQASMHQPFSTTHVPWRARLPWLPGTRNRRFRRLERSQHGAVDRETEWRARTAVLFESGTTSSNPPSSSGESVSLGYQRQARGIGRATG